MPEALYLRVVCLVRRLSNILPRCHLLRSPALMLSRAALAGPATRDTLRDQYSSYAQVLGDPNSAQLKLPVHKRRRNSHTIKCITSRHGLAGLQHVLLPDFPGLIPQGIGSLRTAMLISSSCNAKYGFSACGLK